MTFSGNVTVDLLKHCRWRKGSNIGFPWALALSPMRAALYWLTVWLWLVLPVHHLYRQGRIEKALKALEVPDSREQRAQN